MFYNLFISLNCLQNEIKLYFSFFSNNCFELKQESGIRFINGVTDKYIVIDFIIQYNGYVHKSV